jgi:hypothetical protein
MNLGALLLLWQGKVESRVEFKNLTYDCLGKKESGKVEKWPLELYTVH